MDAATVSSHISELDSLRSRTRIWRTGATLLALLIAVVCVGTMYANIRSLFQPGPKQDEFVAGVNANLQTNVVPSLQKLAVQTAMESGPIVQTEAGKLSNRLPDIAQASMDQFQLLQKNLPERSEKALDDTFGTMMKTKEAKLKQMFPNATDEQIQTLTNNLTDVGVTSLSNLNKQLFAKHIDAINGIAADIDSIEKVEAPHLKGETPTWQMGMMLFDIAREDLKDMPTLTSTGSTPASASAGKAKLQAVELPLKPTAAAKPAPASKSSGY